MYITSCMSLFKAERIASLLSNIVVVKAHGSEMGGPDSAMMVAAVPAVELDLEYGNEVIVAGEQLLINDETLEAAYLFVSGEGIYEGAHVMFLKVEGIWYDCVPMTDCVGYALDMTDEQIKAVVDKFIAG